MSKAVERVYVGVLPSVALTIANALLTFMRKRRGLMPSIVVGCSRNARKQSRRPAHVVMLRFAACALCTKRSTGVKPTGRSKDVSTELFACPSTNSHTRVALAGTKHEAKHLVSVRLAGTVVLSGPNRHSTGTQWRSIVKGIEKLM